MSTEPGAVFWGKVGQILKAAVEGLDPDDRDARIAHDRASMAAGRQCGITMHPEGGMLRFDWAGRTLCAVEREILSDDSADVPAPGWIPAVPDDPRALFDD